VQILDLTRLAPVLEHAHVSRQIKAIEVVRRFHTREAVALYLRKLKPRGCLALHLTNGYLALEPVVTAIAADLRVPAAVKSDTIKTPEQAFEGKDYSKWAVMVREDADAIPVREVDGWSRTRSDRGAGADEFLWTDDRANLVGLLRRR
jgi:hypothetical protein